MSSRDKNLPYEILMLSHFGFKYCIVTSHVRQNHLKFGIELLYFGIIYGRKSANANIIDFVTFPVDF